MSKDIILKKIGTIGKAAKKLTTDIQAVAVDCALHAVEHGDVTLADQLVDALGKGLRKASLRAWFERNTCMYLPKGKQVFAFDGERAKEQRKLVQDELRDTLMALPWEEAKAEEPIVSVINVEEAFDKFISRITKQVSEASVEVKNAELLQALNQAAAKWHAERVLSN